MVTASDELWISPKRVCSICGNDPSSGSDCFGNSNCSTQRPAKCGRSLSYSTFTFTGLTFAKAKRDLRREEDPRFGDFSQRSC